MSLPTDVLVQGNTIARITTSAIQLEPGPHSTLIHGQGRTLMPGLIDAHWHTMMAPVTVIQGLTAGIGYLNLVAGRERKRP